MRTETMFFGVDETLVEDTRDWNEWAGYLGVSQCVFHTSLRAAIERGEHHRTVFDLMRPGVDFAALR